MGINGSGISAVACIAKNKGFEVSGCDLNEVGDYTEQLVRNNIKISKGHDVSHLKDVDIVVLSPALLYKDKYKTIEETRVAMETRKTIKWQKFLGEYIMNNQNVVAVSGTHGKTTTTTLMGLILEKDDFDPTVFVGGIVKEWNQSYRVGNSDYYVCEADEYDGNFLNYNPKYVILNNMEMEHPERFKNFEEYKENFKNFIKTIQKNGKIVFYYDDQNVLDLISSMVDFLKEKNIKIIAFTFNTKLKKSPDFINLVKVKKEKNKIIINDNEIEFKILGDHNTKNVAIASILSMELGVKMASIKEVIKNFTGSKRRMDLVFSGENVQLYDDYAHHHTQIECTLNAIRGNMKEGDELIAVLEPHLISRIRDNVEEFKKALLIADYPIITKIYKSRESFMEDIDVKKLLNCDKISYIESHQDVIDTIEKLISNKNKNYVIVVMGAGNSYKITRVLKEYLENTCKY